jgi:hypothetical protein
MKGAGKFNDACTKARENIGPGCVLCAVIAIDATKGNGFSVQCVDRQLMEFLPKMLEEMAAQMQRDLDDPRSTHWWRG